MVISAVALLFVMVEEAVGVSAEGSGRPFINSYYYYYYYYD